MPFSTVVHSEPPKRLDAKPPSRMANLKSDSEHVSDVDTVLLDVELFMKYQAPERAIKRLRTALEVHPRSIPLRERLRQLAAANKQADEAARQCLALASLYIERDEFDGAYDRLLEAKQLDPRINIAGGLAAIRRARRPDLNPQAAAKEPEIKVQATLAGSLADVSVFDAVQVLENAKLTGVLILTGEAREGEVFFNEGRIVGAQSQGATGEKGFTHVVEITSGTFEFHKSQAEFPVTIQASSNTNLLLDTLRRLDEKKI